MEYLKIGVFEINLTNEKGDGTDIIYNLESIDPKLYVVYNL